MKITNTSREFTPVEQYKLTKSPSIILIKNVEDGEVLEVNGWLTFEDENSNGEVSNMLSIMGKNPAGDTEVWSCQSKTFKNNFMDIYNLFNGEPFTIVKISGTTKAGRQYIDCDLAM